MKKNLHSQFIVFSLLLVSIFSPTLKAQSLDSTTISRLYYTCKVWGYLKYFHSEVAKGTRNWDSILVSTIPAVQAATTGEEFNNALMTMFNYAGPMAVSNAGLPSVPDSMRFNLNLAWIDHAVLNGAVHDSLTAVRNRFRPQNNYYLGQAFANGNPTFDNDNKYYNSGYPSDSSVRLLGLFRYWNAIHYFNPYKNIIDRNWENVLTEFIPIMIHADDPLSYHKAIFLLQNRIDDSHGATLAASADIRLDSIYGWYPGGANYYLPLWLKQIGSETVVFKSLDTNLVKPGDIIRYINNVPIDTIRNSIRPYTQGSHAVVIERNINYRISRGKQNGQVTLKVENTSGLRDVALTYSIQSDAWRSQVFRSAPVWQIITPPGSSKKIGYINMENIFLDQVGTVFSNLRNTNAIIFDLRNYPNGTLWTIVRYLFPSSIHIADFTVPNIQYPGTLYWFSEIIGGSPFSTPYNRKIMMLCEEETQSQSEYTIMGFQQHPGSKVIGSQTSGAEGNVTYVYWPGGISTAFTGLGVFYPDHRPTQRIGIVPDIEVHPTIEGIRQGKDEVLEAAINYWLSTADTTSPQVTVGALASPVVNVVRFGIGSNEALSSIALKVNSSLVSLQQQGELYFGNYTLGDVNSLSIEVTATDANLNVASLTKNYQIAPLAKGLSYKNYSFNGEGSGYLLLSESVPENIPAGWKALGEAVEITVTGINERISLEANYQTDDLDQSKIGVYRFESGQWKYLGGEGHDGQLSTAIQNGKIAVFYNPDHVSVPTEFALENNYPNPFNPTTTIRYAVPFDSKVSLKVYNILGQEVRSLVNGFKPIGRYQVMWDGRNNSGSLVSSGVYLYRMEAGKFIQTRKMLLVK